MQAWTLFGMMNHRLANHVAVTNCTNRRRSTSLPSSVAGFDFHFQVSSPGLMFWPLFHSVTLFPQIQKLGGHWVICSTASFFASANSLPRLFCDGHIRVPLGALGFVKALLWLSRVTWGVGSVFIFPLTLLADFIFCELFPSRVVHGHCDGGVPGDSKAVARPLPRGLVAVPVRSIGAQR